MIDLVLFFFLALTIVPGFTVVTTTITENMLSCPMGSIEWKNECYFFQNDLEEFYYAEQQCIQLGGHLASIHDEQTDTFLTHVLDLFNQSIVTEIWIGLNNPTQGNEWIWVDETLYEYTKWGEGEPKSVSGAGSACGVLLNDGFWKVDGCYEDKPYICKVNKISDVSPCPDGSIEWMRKCLFFKNETATFNTAFTECNKTGNLVSIHDETTNSFLVSTGSFYNNSQVVHDVWIGLAGVAPSRIWEWTDGTPLNFTNWALGEPAQNKTFCASLSVADGLWKAEGCYQIKPYICAVDVNVYEDTTTIFATTPEITSRLSDTYVPCKSWISFAFDDSCSINATSFKKQMTFIAAAIGVINHPERIEVHGAYNQIVKWNNETDIGQIQSKVINATQTRGSYSLAKQLKYLIANKQGIETDEMGMAALIFISDTSDQALDGAGQLIEQLAGIRITFIIVGNDQNPSQLLNISTNFIYWGDLNEFYPDDWNLLSIAAYGCKQSSTTISSKQYDTTTPIQQSSITTSSIAIFSTSSTTTTTVSSPKGDDGTISKWWYIGGGIAVTVISIGLIIFILYHKRKSNKRLKRRRSFEEKLESTPLEARLSTEERQKKYIEKKRIQYDYNEILGKGANAVVYKATYAMKKTNKSINNFNEPCTVALKIPTNFVTNDDIEEFVRELDALIKIGSHPSVIKFLGWTLQQQTPVLVTELAQTDLLQLVRKCRGTQLPIKNILSILWQITLALSHIASLSMVHRDVACRNILLTESGVAKLADFGLCCQCDESFTYRASLHKRLPLKWCSIEALVDRLFSEKSDVWSFGVLCYEAFSYGAVPFPALSNVEMLEALQAGKRLEKPAKASNEIYGMMLKCWKEKPVERPTFKELSETLKVFLENETCTYGYLALDVLPDMKTELYDTVNEV